MTIASEISRLQWAKTDIKTAIEAKGVTVPSSAKLDTYDDYIAQISSWPWLLSYDQLLLIANAEWEPRANTRAELNSHPDEYVEYLDSEWKIYWQVTPRVLWTVNWFWTWWSTMYPKWSWMEYDSTIWWFCYLKKKLWEIVTEDCS